MIEKFIKRRILEEIRKDLGRKEIAFVVGPRQYGVIF
jgi:predicted AAA+ superfamily ATPase